MGEVYQKKKQYYNYYYQNKLNDKMYVGKGTRGRVIKHISAAFSPEGTYKNEREQHLERAIRKYGIENFEYSIYQYCDSEDEAYLIEDEWIKRLRDEFGIELYNIADGGPINQSGIKRSEETKQKMSIALRKHYEEFESPLTGKPLSEEHCRNISIGSMGKTGTNTGKTFDEEWVLKISKSNAGKDKIKLRRFSDQEEKEICRLYMEEEMSGYKLAQNFDCQRSMIYEILRRNNIKQRQSNYRGHNNGKNIFTIEQEQEICQIYQEGKITRKELAKRFGCGKTTIRDILLRHDVKL